MMPGGLVVPTTTDGITATPIEPKLGMRASTRGDITLNQARVPADAVGRRVVRRPICIRGADSSSPLTGRPACRRQARP
jgi:hypothetical protein